MYKIRIVLWHGGSAKIENKLNSFCVKDEHGWVFTGTFDDFVNTWQDKFICFISEEKDEDYLVGVTDCNSFNAR